MQQAGQYGEVPSYSSRPSSAPATGNASAPAHSHLFNLSHETAAAAVGGLGLSSNSPSISAHAVPSAGHQHHATGATHAYSFGQVLQNQSLLQQQRQPYLHFQDHRTHHHHHHQQQGLQSSAHACQQPQQQLIDHSATPSSSSPAGLQLHQSSQKQAMVPSISMGLPQHGAGMQDTQSQMHQSSILQQQYTQRQQQHSLGLGLDQSPKPSSVSALQQQVSRISQQQHASASSSQGGTTAATALAVVSSSGQPSNAIVQSAASTNLTSSSTAAAAASMSAMVISNMGASGGPTPGLSNLQQQMGGVSAVAGGGNSHGKQSQSDQAAAIVAAAPSMGMEKMQDALGDELDMKGGISGGNRWPRQETLALLKVRSEMDSSFRDSNLKRPLWDEVSRKLAELGFHRSAKKCKEKFENVHKYYKRTKEGKAGRQDGKNYRFFSELEALYGNAGNNPPRGDLGVRSSTSFLIGNSVGASARTPDMPARASNPSATFVRPLTAEASGLNFLSETSSSEDELDDDYDEPSDVAPPDSKKRKRKTLSRMMAFFESLLKQVMEKQEQMQQRFLDALERREQDRMIREEAWKRQEMARMSRENDLRAQERSLAATRDAAIVAFLQKVTGQTIQLPTTTALAIAASPVQVHPPLPGMPMPSSMDLAYHNIPEDQDPFDPNSKRWPKPEVLALIKLRTGLHPRFTEPGPKGPLWEDIANGMSRLGYNRNAKRCKEKWENINKYFKKAKESNKNRPENAKTCPYYHQLDALYKQGVLGGGSIGNVPTIKALPYKPASESLEISADNPLLAHHSSGRIGREGELVAISSNSDMDQVQSVVPLASQMSTASDATAVATVSSANAGAVHFYPASNPESGAVGHMISKDVGMPRAGEISPDQVRLVDVNGETQVMAENVSPRVEPSAAEDIAVQRTSLQMQNSCVDDAQHCRSASNHGYAEHKVDLEQEGRQQLVEEDEAQHKQQVLLQAHMQQYQQEIRVSTTALQPAPPGLSTQSFIANMLHKVSNDPAESNTSTASTNQEH